MNCPFRELHELYRIVYLRNEAQAEAEKEREQKEKENKERQERARPYKERPLPPNRPPSDAITKPSIPMPSPYIAGEIEDALEEMF